MKGLKRFFVGLVLIAIVVAVCVFYLVDSTLNTVVKSHIERRGTFLIGTETDSTTKKNSTKKGGGRGRNK